MLIKIIKARRKTNIILALLCLALIALLLFRIKSAFNDYYQKYNIIQATNINITRILSDNSKQSLEFDKLQQKWHMQAPQNINASEVVIKTLLENIAQCSDKYPEKSVNTIYSATIKVDEYTYDIGERNPILDKIYVRNGNKVMLCNKLIASIAHASLINFYNKELFDGQIVSIESSLEKIIDNNILKQISFDVEELASIDTSHVEDSIVDEFFIISEKDNLASERKFSIVINDKQYLLFIDMEKNLAYAVLNQPIFKHLLGLDENGKPFHDDNKDTN